MRQQQMSSDGPVRKSICAPGLSRITWKKAFAQGGDSEDEHTYIQQVQEVELTVLGN